MGRRGRLRVRRHFKTLAPSIAVLIFVPGVIVFWRFLALDSRVSTSPEKLSISVALSSHLATRIPLINSLCFRYVQDWLQSTWERSLISTMFYLYIKRHDERSTLFFFTYFYVRILRMLNILRFTSGLDAADAHFFLLRRIGSARIEHHFSALLTLLVNFNNQLLLRNRLCVRSLVTPYFSLEWWAL